MNARRVQQHTWRSLGWRRLRTALLAVELALIIALESMAGAWQGSSARTPPSPAGAPASSSPVAVPAYRQADHIAVLSVEGMIDDVTLKSLERRMAKARADGAQAVVLDINTKGGEVTAALNICNLLKNRTETPANVVAWVHPEAYSAGTIIALACREILVSPGSTFGDAAPIGFSPFIGIISLPDHERAKLLAPILSELVDSARRNHYDENLVKSFVTLTDGLWMLENVTTGEHVFVGLEEYRNIFGQDPPVSAVPGGPPPVSQPRRSMVLPQVDLSIPRQTDEAGLSEEELKQQREFDQLLPPVRQELTDADRNDWRLVRRVVDSSSLLTVKADEALYYGLAAAVVANDVELKNYFGASTLTRYDQVWSEGLVRFLTNFWVKAILIVIFLVSLFIELAAPGVGVFGATAAVALLVLVGAPALMGLAHWWGAALIALGLLLVALELFVIPGLGILGVGGVVCVLAGLVGTFVTSDLDTAAGQRELGNGLLATLAAIFVAGVFMWLISRQIHSFPIINRMILHAELRDGSTTAPSGLLEAMAPGMRALQPGDIGAAETDLRPSGRASFNGRLFDVNAVGSYIEKGTPLRVVSVGRFVIEVEESGS